MQFVPDHAADEGAISRCSREMKLKKSKEKKREAMPELILARRDKKWELGLKNITPYTIAYTVFPCFPHFARSEGSTLKLPVLLCGNHSDANPTLMRKV